MALFLRSRSLSAELKAQSAEVSDESSGGLFHRRAAAQTLGLHVNQPVPRNVIVQ